MKINKRYTIIVAILAIYLIIFFVFFGYDSFKKGKLNATIFIGDSTIWKYSDNSWTNITTSSTIDELSWQKYNVFENNSYKGNYLLWYDDNKWYAFEDDKSAVQIEGEFLAYQANYDLNIKSFETKTNSNNTYVHQVLTENNLNTASQMTINNIAQIDIDNDGIAEDFYIISNAFALDFYPETIFSIVFMVKDQQVYSMYTNIEDAKYGNSCKPYIRAVLDIDEDNTHEVIVSCGKYSVQTPEDMLYQLTEEGFKLLISNQ